MPSIKPFITTDITQAANWLTTGKVLAYPTESVWGIGCDPFNELAVTQLLAIKQRPVDKGMILITDSAMHLVPLLAPLSRTQRETILNSWYIAPNTASSTAPQQAHTWLLPLSTPLTVNIPTWITGAHNSIAVRVIAHPLIQALCTKMLSSANPYGFIVSTSCNLAGQPPALSLAQAQTYFANSTFAEQVGYLQGETLGYQLPSQIHNATTGIILR